MQGDIHKTLTTTTFGTRSYANEVHKELLEADLLQEASQIILDAVASSVSSAQTVINAARKVSTRIHTLIGKELPNDHSLLKYGTSVLDVVAQTGLIDVEKHPTISKGSVKELWYVVSLSQELTDYASILTPSKSMPSPIQGFKEWTKATMQSTSGIIPIVKKADRYQVLDWYSEEKMPEVYRSLNRLGKQSFRINSRILRLTETAPLCAFDFVPDSVSEDQRKTALRSINDITRKAKFIEEIRFKEMNKWLLDEADMVDESLANKISKKKASEQSQDYFDTKVEEHVAIISAWSKRMDFDKVVKLALEWMDDDINFLFNQDTRGRIYAVQNYLTPLGSDFAKSLLVFGDKHQVSGYDFCIHIANCFGQDKLSFEERVEWVNNNSQLIYLIGLDPLNSSNEIKELELEGEQKTKWQGIAAAIEYVKFVDWIEVNGTEEGFKTDLIIGLDSTASGTQILSMLGRDDRVAPHVNITKSTTGQVGDFYTFLSAYLKPKLETHRGQSDTLDAILDNWSKYARKLAKRNSMTFSYSGTKFGFGQQHWEDRHSYGSLGSNLTRGDCRIIGNEMYDVCVENIRGGAEIMKWLRDGIDLHTGGAMISWTLPDGFRAFQVADDSKRQQLKCSIGSRNLSLNYYLFQDKPKKSDHKNGVAPNWIHSYDAYLLRLIVLGMPEEAPISTVHDQFSTTSYYIEELQQIAKDAYKIIGCRDTAELICEEAFGKHRPLPKVGTWELNEIDNAEFIVC